jgi:hypothetical protein
MGSMPIRHCFALRGTIDDTARSDNFSARRRARPRKLQACHACRYV